MIDINLIVPQNRLPLHLSWFLIDNAGGVTIPYGMFAEISPSYKKRIHLHNAIKKIRPFLKMHNYNLVAEVNFGYRCYKV